MTGTKFVICPEKITSPAPPPGWTANLPCGAKVPIVTPAEAMDCRCPHGHRFYASLRDIREES